MGRYYGLLILGLIGFLTSCVDKIEVTNPYDTAYSGDYSFKLSSLFDSAGNGSQNKACMMEPLFQAYYMGKDTFKIVKILDTSNISVLGENQFNRRVKSSNEGMIPFVINLADFSLDSISIPVVAQSPNGGAVFKDTISLAVANPFKLQTVSANYKEQQVFNFELAIDKSIRVYWMCTPADPAVLPIMDTLALGEPFRFDWNTLMPYTVTAKIAKAYSGKLGVSVSEFEDGEYSVLSRGIWTSGTVVPAVTKPAVIVDSVITQRVGLIKIPLRFLGSCVKFYSQRDLGAVEEQALTGDLGYVSYSIPRAGTSWLKLWAVDQKEVVSDTQAVLIQSFIPDTIPPVLSVSVPDRLYSSTHIITAAVKDNFGVVRVSGTIDDTLVTEFTRVNDTLWSGTFTGLPDRKPVSVTICAVDSFSLESKKTVQLLFDNSLNDTGFDSLYFKSSTPADGRIYSGTGSVAVRAWDKEGVSKVSVSVNGGTPAVLPVSGTGDYVYSFDFGDRYGKNTIDVTAEDNSPQHNARLIRASYVFDMLPIFPEVVNPSPVTGSIGHTKIGGMRLVWASSKSLDSDPVVYRVWYGVGAADKMIETADTTCLIPESDLIWGASHIWNVTAVSGIDSKRYPDTENFVFGIRQEDTGFDDLTVLKAPTSGRIKKGSDTIVFTASDVEGVSTVYAQVDGGTPVVLNANAGEYRYSFDFGTDYRAHVIEITAVDGSHNKNRKSVRFDYVYDPEIQAAPIVAPLENDTIEYRPTALFSWGAAVDPNDPVKYKIIIDGTEYDAGGSTSYPLFELLGGTDYQWRLMSYTSKDTVWTPSKTTYYSFRTKNHPTVFPKMDTVKASINDDIPLNLDIKDDEGIQSVKYYYKEKLVAQGTGKTTLSLAGVTTIPGVYPIEIKTLDTKNVTCLDTMYLNVSNNSPVIKCSDTISVFIGDSIPFDINVSDDGISQDTIFLGNTAIELNNKPIKKMIDYSAKIWPNNISYSIKSTDDDGNITKDTIVIKVNVKNTIPYICNSDTVLCRISTLTGEKRMILKNGEFIYSSSTDGINWDVVHTAPSAQWQYRKYCILTNNNQYPYHSAYISYNYAAMRNYWDAEISRYRNMFTMFNCNGDVIEEMKEYPINTNYPVDKTTTIGDDYVMLCGSEIWVFSPFRSIYNGGALSSKHFYKLDKSFGSSATLFKSSDEELVIFYGNTITKYNRQQTYPSDLKEVDSYAYTSNPEIPNNSNFNEVYFHNNKYFIADGTGVYVSNDGHNFVKIYKLPYGWMPGKPERTNWSIEKIGNKLIVGWSSGDTRYAEEHEVFY